jgi:type IV secretory pathway VirB10-like protein
MIVSGDSTNDSGQTDRANDQMLPVDNGSAAQDRGSHDSESGAPLHTGTGPLWPALPLARRLNRNALTVAAALAGITVLTVVVVTRPTHVPRGGPNGSALAAADAAPPVPARPVFLDQPPHEPQIGDRSSVNVITGSQSHASGGIGHQASGDGGTGLPVPPPLQGSADVGAIGPGPEDSIANAARPSGSMINTQSRGADGMTPRRQAYQAALTSPVMVPERESHDGEAPAPPITEAGSTGGASSDTRTRGSVPGNESPGVGSAFPPVSGTTALHEPLTSGSGIRIPVGAQSTTPAVSVATESDVSSSVYTVRAGSVIPGLLLTGINSDLPGEILGQTSRDLFDSRTEQTLLVPKGSRLIGSYDNRSVNTGRLIVAWTRLILPDGRSWSLPNLAATDEVGEMGLHDKVNHHYARVYGAALLTSVISAGVQLSQPQQSALYAAPSSRQVAAGALGQNLGDVALESAKRGLDTPPTVTIRPGQPFDVFLSGDIAFDGPYVAAPLSVGR